MNPLVNGLKMANAVQKSTFSVADCVALTDPARAIVLLKLAARAS